MISKKILLAAIAITPVIAISAENPFKTSSGSEAGSNLDRRLDQIEQQSMMNSEMLNEIMMNSNNPSVPMGLGRKGVSNPHKGKVFQVIGEMDGNCIYKEEAGILGFLSEEDRNGETCAEHKAKYSACLKYTCDDFGSSDEAAAARRMCGSYAEKLEVDASGNVCSMLSGILSSLPSSNPNR